MTRVEDLTWTEFEQQLPLVPYWIIVTGSVEQHGPHLPLGADTLVVERLAELVSERHGALILGTVRAGVLHAYREWPGGQHVPADAFGGYVQALARAAIAAGGDRLLILNGHDENHEPLLTAARELVDQHGTDIVVVEWAKLVSDVIRDVSESRSESHGGEGLTSLFLHWYPDRVRRKRIAEGTLPEGRLTRDDLHVVKRAHHVVRHRRADIPTGVLGDPRRATAAKGEIIAKALVDRVDAVARERGWL